MEDMKFSRYRLLLVFVLFCTAEGIPDSAWGGKKESTIPVHSIPAVWDSRVVYPQCFQTQNEGPAQGQCDSSWALAAVNTFSRRSCIFGLSERKDKRQHFRLSSQHLVSCIKYGESGSMSSSPSIFTKVSLAHRELNRIALLLTNSVYFEGIEDASDMVNLNDRVSEIQDLVEFQFEWESELKPSSNGQWLKISTIDGGVLPSSETFWDCSKPGSLEVAWEFIHKYGLVENSCIPSFKGPKSKALWNDCGHVPNCADGRIGSRKPKCHSRSRNSTLSSSRLEKIIKSIHASEFLTCGATSGAMGAFSGMFMSCDSIMKKYKTKYSYLTDPEAKGCKPSQKLFTADVSAITLQDLKLPQFRPQRSMKPSMVSGHISLQKLSKTHNNAVEIQKAIMSGGSVSACLSSEVFGGYQNENSTKVLICKAKVSPAFGHCLEIIGWGKDDRGPYWITLDRPKKDIVVSKVYTRGSEIGPYEWGESCGLEVTAMWADPWLRNDPYHETSELSENPLLFVSGDDFK